MLTNISWANYILVVTILLAIYYLFMGLRFYNHELRNIFLKGRIQLGAVLNKIPNKAINKSGSDQGFSEPSQDSFKEDANEAFQEAENLISRLKEAIEYGLRNQLSKQDLSKNLKLVLLDYPSLKNSTFRAAIIELIISECEKYGSTILNEDEVAVLWDSD